MKLINCLYALLLGALLLTSCEVRVVKHGKHKKTVAVHVIKPHMGHDDVEALQLYWYIIQQHSTGTYYTYSSPTPISNYTGINWTRSVSIPSNVKEELEQNPENEVQVEVEDLSAEMQTEIDTNAEDFGGMTADEMGDYEGGADGGSGRAADEEDAEAESENDAEADADADADSGDSSDGGDSGSDSGGGDSGGDGGGGDGGGGE